MNIVAITTVAGNTYVDQVTKNVTKVLAACNKEIPVYVGASRPFVRKYETAQFYHGMDGLGDNPKL